VVLQALGLSLDDQAIAAGAQSIEAPSDMPYGDRRATVSDAWGNLWQIAVFQGAKGRSGSGSAQPE
jgi:uncharacterized glyoxalase superfamily protein PhnB